MIRTAFYIIFCWIYGALNAAAQRSPSVVISEIMADPSPAIGLPEVEYLELYNSSSEKVSLKGWKLKLGNQFISFPDSVMAPQSYSIVCHNKHVETIKSLGSVIGLTTFALTNDHMQIILLNSQNEQVHEVNYQNSWWETGHRNGGYALEIKDVQCICCDRNNWLTSRDASGGTPGKFNSFQEIITDTTSPKVNHIEFINNSSFVIVFDEKMDAHPTGDDDHMVIVSGRNVVKRELELPALRRLHVQLDKPMQAGISYEVTIRGVADCFGIRSEESVWLVGIPSTAAYGDLLINEVLFHPFENGVDFVELYNQSSKFISLKNWTLGNARTDLTQDNFLISAQDILLPPHGYLALTTGSEIVKEQYPTPGQQGFLDMPGFPSLPTKEGMVVLRNGVGQWYDQMEYSENMHHPLLSSSEGVSLEKQFPEKSALDLKNWQSASSSVGYATPGYMNSQSKRESAMNRFQIIPEAFSPDGDGIDDTATLLYEQNLAGNVATVNIYNTGGRMIKTLLRNQLLGTAGTLAWDGRDQHGDLVPTGYYFLLIDVFSVGGESERYRCKVVVATRQR